MGVEGGSRQVGSRAQSRLRMSIYKCSVPQYWPAAHYECEDRSRSCTRTLRRSSPGAEPCPRTGGLGSRSLAGPNDQGVSAVGRRMAHLSDVRLQSKGCLPFMAHHFVTRRAGWPGLRPAHRS